MSDIDTQAKARTSVHGKQALREFQSRLAERLQSVQTAGTTSSWLGLESGGQAFLFPLSHTGEIFSWTDVRHVPYTQSWMLGVASLRGGVYSVVDLAAFLAPDHASRTRTDDEMAQCRLTTFSPLLEVHSALLVDRLLGLHTPASFAASAVPAAGSPDYYGHVYTDVQERQWQEINLQVLSRNAAFLGTGTGV